MAPRSPPLRSAHASSPFPTYLVVVYHSSSPLSFICSRVALRRISLSLFPVQSSYTLPISGNDKYVTPSLSGTACNFEHLQRHMRRRPKMPSLSPHAPRSPQTHPPPGTRALRMPPLKGACGPRLHTTGRGDATRCVDATRSPTVTTYVTRRLKNPPARCLAADFPSCGVDARHVTSRYVMLLDLPQYEFGSLFLLSG